MPKILALAATPLLGAVLLTAPVPAPTLVIRGARIADGSGGPIISGKAILVAGDAIQAIDPPRETDPQTGTGPRDDVAESPHDASLVRSNRGQSRAEIGQNEHQ